MPIQRVVLVGHCGFDSGMLGQFAKQMAPGAEVVRVNSQASLEPACSADTLLLVNRVLDGRFAVGGSGIALIQSLAERADAPAMMLVSNYEDAQAQAVAAGALPGFGKSQLADPSLAERMTRSLASRASGGE
ncbi:MAG: hypothetical protein ACE37H_12915 [Phycisphaeraceae bacterium]